MPSTAAEPIHVIAGLLERGGRLFLTRRPAHAHLGGLWEFPGGKLAAGEAPAAGLRRELQEELGIEVVRAAPFARVRHDYPEKSVLLEVWRVTAYRGEAHGREGQEARWVDPGSVSPSDMPAADRPILRRLQLPSCCLISAAADLGVEVFLSRLDAALAAGARLVQLREPSMEPAALAALARELIGRCRAAGARLVINGDPALALRLGADGVHLASRRLMEISSRPLPFEFLVGASCHHPAELAQAERIGCDYAFLSPVAATASHPQAMPLGWEQFQTWAASVSLPVYALGGMRPQDLPVAQAAGAQGIALRSGAWKRGLRRDETACPPPAGLSRPGR